MHKVGDVVVLKSGGPEMIINHIFGDTEGSKDKAAAMKGFAEGDCSCEWQEQIGEDKFRSKKESFKAVMLKDVNGRPLGS